MTPDQWADSDEWPLPTYSGSSKVAATFHPLSTSVDADAVDLTPFYDDEEAQDGTQDARKGQGEGSGEIERLRAVVASEAAVAAVQGAIRVAKHEHRAIRAVTCACGGWWSMAHQEEHVAVAAADAAAPHIAAQALRDAADEVQKQAVGLVLNGESVRTWLRMRAHRMEAGR